LSDHPAASEEEHAKQPWSLPPNKWPREHLPGLEPAFKKLGQLMFQCCLHLARHLDRIAHKEHPSYAPDTLFRALEHTMKVKGRLLYYYPTDRWTEEDAWIGWHNDSGFLTALTSAIYVDNQSGRVIPNPDPEGGLWIVDRAGGSVQVKIPADQLAIQCGECLQIITGGLFVATPHCVRASRSAADGPPVARITFPVFVDTPIDFPLAAPAGVPRERVFDKTMKSRVPPLASRWLRDNVPFGEFLGDTFKQYYEWAKKPALTESE
jgi:isopenicillin N synthase-like dioxygenase